MRCNRVTCLLLTTLLSATGAWAGRAVLTDFESQLYLQRTGEGMEPGCAVERSDECAHSGEHAARIAYDFVAKDGRQYVALGLSLEMAGQVSSVSAWFRGDESGLPIVLRITDAGGEVHQYRWRRLDFTGWRELTVELRDPVVVYGGDENRAIDWPVRLTQVIIDHGSNPVKGVVCVDDITYSTDASADQFVTATIRGTEPGNVYVMERRPPRLIAEVHNGAADTDVEGEVETTLIGPDDERVAVRTADCRLAAGQRLALEEVLLEPSRAGLYELEVALKAGGTGRVLATAPICVLPDEGSTAPDPASPFGACTHFAQGKGRLPDTMQLLARAGVKWLRDECSWAAVEKERGVYTFPEITERYLTAAREYGIAPLIIFDYGNPLYDEGNAPASDEAQHAFGEYCFQMVQRFKHLCKHWEVYNEPNIRFWKPEPDPPAYARLLKVAYAAAKRADPECTVAGICTAGTDLKFIRAVLEESGPASMDALSIHPYRYPRSPEASDFVGEVTRARDLLSEYGGGERPVWLTEIGWPTHVGERGLSEEAAARMLVRMYVQAMSLPFVGPVVWYDFQNDGMKAEYNEHNFGLIRWDDFSAKAGYLAYRMMTRALEGKSFSRRLALGDESAYAYLFEGKGEATVVAWHVPPDGQPEGDTGRAVALELGAGEFQVSSMTGEIEQMAAEDGTLRLELSPSPVFVRKKGQVQL
jgi:hypothetical protein